MGQQRGSRVFVGVVLGVVAALGITQPGASAESAGSAPAGQVADGSASPDIEQYPTVCPRPSNGTAADSQLPCEPPDPCGEDSDGDGVYNCEDPCPRDPYDTCDDPTPTTPPTTQPPTTQPPTTQPPTTQPPTTQPPTTQPPVPTSTPTVGVPTVAPGCQASCAYLREVELRVTTTKLKGAVDSVAQGCRADATITLWRQKKGADRRLVVLTSKQTGTFRTGRPARAGRYYVTVTSPEQPLCAPATSPTVKVKRS